MGNQLGYPKLPKLNQMGGVVFILLFTPGQTSTLNTIMDKEKFDQFVGQYAEYIYTTDPCGTGSRGPRNRSEVDCEEQQNPTATLKVVKWLPRTQLCGDCLKTVSHAPVRNIQWSFAKNIWLIRCHTCKHNYNNTTGVFEASAFVAKKLKR